MDPPKSTATQLVFALLTIAIAIWYMGFLLGYALTGYRNSVPVAIAAVAGPGLLIVQQYRATFRASVSAARFCVGINGVVILLLLVALFLEGLILSVPVYLLLTANWQRYAELDKWQRSGPGENERFRFEIVDLMMLVLGFSVVMAIARYYAHS